MNIVVCIKQVLDTKVVKIDTKTGTLIREGVISIMNPEDKHALEVAIQLKEQVGGKVTVISMGLPMAKSVLREALYMGADEAILLTDRSLGGSDTLATSKSIAGVIKKLDYDLVFTGRRAIDGDTGQVGPEIEEHLHIPQVTYVKYVKVEGDKLIVNRALEDGYQLIEVKTPCLLTVIEELNETRYMNLVKIFETSYDEIKVMSVDDIDVYKSEIGFEGSPTKVKKSMIKEAKGVGEIIRETPKNAAYYVVRKLKEKHYI